MNKVIFLDLILTVISSLLMGVILLLICFLIFIILEISSSGSLGIAILTSSLYLSLYLSIYFFILKKRRISFRELGFRNFHLNTLWKMIPLSIFLLFLNLILISLIGYFFSLPDNSEDPLNSAIYIQDFIWLFIAIAIIAPIVEEITFRGILYSYLKNKYTKNTALLLSSIIFGILHLVFPPLFLMGMVLGFLYEKYDSLYPSIFLHAINNGIIVILYALIMLNS